MRYTAIGLLWLACASVAFAECYLDGQAYEDGAVVSGYICSGGEWRKL